MPEVKIVIFYIFLLRIPAQMNLQILSLWLSFLLNINHPEATFQTTVEFGSPNILPVLHNAFRETKILLLKGVERPIIIFGGMSPFIKWSHFYKMNNASL